jgi:3'5'-cyclic nucleotide phosphodiesterase
MESNSACAKIMCSQKTADLIISAGKGHWLSAQSDLVDAKGKGKMKCYWCNPTNVITASTQADHIRSPSKLSRKDSLFTDTRRRLVDWMAEMFEDLLNELVSTRRISRECIPDMKVPSNTASMAPRDEVSEIIILPKVNSAWTSKRPSKMQFLSLSVKEQLQRYIFSIAEMYRENHFHNFEHACHVVMATKKLLSRVVESKESSVSATAYGITSDPLTQFAIVFSALIHDVDHLGVSNEQLAKEKAPIAVHYHNRSIAEQNSFSIAWDLLLDEKYDGLYRAIMPTSSERQRFRQTVVNSVMATDLFDSDLKLLRENRWCKAFQNDSTQSLTWEGTDDDCNRRATIVIEMIIQASDVSHTMQHWHLYQKWNRRLYNEMYTAYAAGRAEKDPSVGWYESELWFFDNYIIPLAKKLKTCGVFGVSCDELLDYATENRAEWAVKGREIVRNNALKYQVALEEAPPTQNEQKNNLSAGTDETKLENVCSTPVHKLGSFKLQTKENLDVVQPGKGSQIDYVSAAILLATRKEVCGECITGPDRENEIKFERNNSIDGMTMGPSLSCSQSD